MDPLAITAVANLIVVLVRSGVEMRQIIQATEEAGGVPEEVWVQALAKTSAGQKWIDAELTRRAGSPE